MDFPEIGDCVTTEQALALCRYFKLHYLTDRIIAGPHHYKEWTFDGCSGLPDELMGLFTDVTGRTLLTNAVCPTTWHMLTAPRETTLNASVWT